MSRRVLAVCFLIISVLSGYMRFGREPSDYSEALTIIFLVSTAALLLTVLRLLLEHVDQIGAAVSREHESRSD